MSGRDHSAPCPTCGDYIGGMNDSTCDCPPTVEPLVWYVAHPVGGDVPANLARAKRWLRWLIDANPDHAFSCPWLPMVEVLDDAVPAHRARGLRDDIAIALTCYGIVLVGGRVSSGMQRELDAVARAGGTVSDLTSLGDEPPDWDRVLEENDWGDVTPLEVGSAMWSAE